MVRITINCDKCDGGECGECADVCPMEVLLIEGDAILIQNKEECSLCENCVDVCPNEAIKIEDD